MGQAEVDSATRPPARALRPWVDRYLGYRMTGFPPGLHRGLPSAHLTFIVSIGPAVDVVRQTDPTQGPARYRAVLAGLQASSALIAHDGHQEGVAVELTPLGVRALLGVPARALWNTSVELADLMGGGGDELWERLQGPGSWTERFAVCDEILTRVAVGRPVRPELARAWHLLASSGGTTPVAEVAREVGWSRPHLARCFRAELGMGPKLAARVVRFDRARRMIGAGGDDVSLALVAAACGYHDQAHLTRDFTDLAGCPPRRWLREEGAATTVPAPGHGDG